METFQDCAKAVYFVRKTQIVCLFSFLQFHADCYYTLNCKCKNETSTLGFIRPWFNTRDNNSSFISGIWIHVAKFIWLDAF